MIGTNGLPVDKIYPFTDTFNLFKRPELHLVKNVIPTETEGPFPGRVPA